jgi:hypothetical protein
LERLRPTKRKIRLSQELVDRLLRAHTNLVLIKSLDAALHHLLPWDIELGMDEPEQEPEVYEKV